MSWMFNGCSGLTSIDLSNFNTSKVTYLFNMFAGCSSLTSLDLSNFDTSNVTDISTMFSGCENLTSLDLSNFDTQKVTRMEKMFKDCSGLTSLDLSNFNTSKVTNMYSMFDGCSSLTNLDLSHFNTSNVTGMDLMFNGCSSLTSLDLSNFDTSNVPDMNQMFDECSSLTSLDLSSFNTSQVTNMYKMFWSSNNLKTIYVGDGWSTDAVTSSDYMFTACDRLVGGKGTTWKSSNPSDKTYAHIDGGPSNPGYFTAARTGYASYNPTAKLLAFYFDDKRSYHEGRGETTYDLNQGSAKPGWYTDGTYAEVTRVHFDQSFINARPKSTYYWFADMANLDNITNSTYINTSEVKNMESMFQGCRKMTSLDLSHFNTSKVTTMAHMFDGCIQATVLNVSNFDTSNVTDMEGMFSYCNSLTSLDVSHFNTAKVTNMSKMFNTCCDLTSLDVSNFDTSNVTDMSWMFRACLILESLDLSSFNTEKVTNMESMFNLCGQLRTIYIADRNDKWSTAAVTKSDFMFDSCKNLVGGKGTAYASNHVDKTYARIDQPTLRPGYFTVLGTEAYAVYSKSSKTLTFHYDTQRRSYTTPSNVVYDVNMDADDPAWLFSEYVSIVTKVIFNPSFAAVRPTNTSRWFQGMALLTSITGMEYLNTSKVTKMDYMFRGCTELSGVDLSHFDTFYVKSMAGMFQGCSSVTELDLGNFTTRYFLVDTRYMFKDCLSLKTIKVDPIDWNTYDVTSSTEMFSGCNNLVGGQGTRYNASNPTDKTYSRIDGGTDNPGYLTNKNSEGWLYEAYAVYTEEGERTLTFYYDTQKNSRTGSIYNVEYHNWLGTASNLNRVVFDPSFADYRPTSTSEWFLNMSNLLSIEGIEYLNTSEVTDMSFMFNNCIGQYFLMQTLDLSHFNTAKVTNMQAMFANNSHLTTIIVGNGWATDAVTNSPNMFYGCTQLKGDQGTAYNANYLDKTYARLDGGTGSPGYFSHFKEPYACYTSGNKSLTFYYDNQRSSRAGTTYDLNTGNNRPGWTEDYSVASAITTVVFDQSFATALPATTAYWFADMAGLRTITGWENLNTKFVTDMSYMFSNCGMPTLDLSSFDTSSVDTMEGMFSWCFNLTRLDLDIFKTTDVEVMTSMFENCPYLNTICVGTGWTTDGVTESDNMFNGCTRLVGGQGTAYSVANPQDKTYAHLDGGTSNPGYFSRFQAYAVYTQENTTLTFYYDSKRDTRTGTTYDMNTSSNAPGWGAVNSSVTTVIFDSSFADYCPSTTCRWFYVMQNLQTIEGMNHLNTSEVTNMQAMFNLCSSLTRLDLRGFNTAKVTSMGMMFNGCSKLKTIYVGDGWSTAAVTSSSNMFRSCGSLVGGKGTTYNDSNPKDKSYAHIDGEGGPGYFTARTTGIATRIENGQRESVKGQSEEWYTIDGRKLNGMPAKKGVYIQNGKKTVVK
jgi:surface protein